MSALIRKILFLRLFAQIRVRSASLISLLSGVLFLAGAVAAAAGDDCIPNERFVNDPDGRRFLELRWLMDPPGWRVRLRVPAEYVTWADVGCVPALGRGYPDPNYRDVYVHGFSIGVDLPDFTVLHPTD